MLRDGNKFHFGVSEVIGEFRKMKKRLLILGAGRGQIELYKASNEMGITTIAGTMPDNNPPCISMANEVCYMNIANPDEVKEKAKKLNLDGVATCCLDTGIVALGKTCDSLNLIGLNEKSAILCNDKSKMKKSFEENNVKTAKYYEISNECELNEALEKIHLPVIIKATDLQGSRGIYISRTKEAAIKGFREAMSLTKRNYCIIEEYIEGLEFGAQAFVYNEDVLFVMPHGDNTYMSHTAVPIGHYVPFECSDDIYFQIDMAVRKAIKAVGLNNCAVNADLILKVNKVYMIEITGRVGANCLPELVGINYGIEYYKMIAAMAVGDDPLNYWNKRNNIETAGLAKMIISTEKSGIIKNLTYRHDNDADVLDVTFFKHKGDMICKFTDSNDCIGQVVVKGQNMTSCEKKAQEVLSKIIIDVE